LDVVGGAQSLSHMQPTNHAGKTPRNPVFAAGLGKADDIRQQRHAL